MGGLTGFWAGAVIGAGLGVIASVLLEEPLLGFRAKVIALARRAFTRKDIPMPAPHGFTFGPMETTEVIIDGDGKSAYNASNIVCHYEPKWVDLPDDLKALRVDVERDQLSKKQLGEKYMWNGQTYALRRYLRSRSDEEEDLVVHLWFGPSDWYRNCALNAQLDEISVTDEETAQAVTLRTKYLFDVDWSSPTLQPHPYFSNTFGMNACLLTTDDRILFVRRSTEVMSRQGVYHIAVNEGLARPIDRADNDPAPNLFRGLVRGASEELGIEIDQSEITLLTLNADWVASDWGMHGFIRCKYSIEEVLDARRAGARDKWEGMELIPVEFRLDDVIRLVFSGKEWAPNALSCLYHTLVYHFGRKNVDSAIRRRGA